MKKTLALLLGLMVLFYPQKIGADGISKETHDINLYMFGKGGGSSPTMQSNPPGNLSTMVPNTSTDEYQIFHAQNNPPYDIYYWFSDPLKSNISIEDDVHFTIWALCSSPRYLGFILYLEIIESDGGGYGQGVFTGYKLVYDEPIEFNALLSEENLDSQLKKFHIGDRIGIGIRAEYYRYQPPSEVSFIYNSSNYPSHMKICSKSISIDISNSKTSSKKACVNIVITDAFGIYDIAEYRFQITTPFGNNIVRLEVKEDQLPENGKVIIEITWDKSEEGSGNYTITIIVVDNNGNHWTKVETLELNFLNNGNGLLFSLNFFILLGIGIFVAILFYSYILRKGKKQ